MNSIAAKFVDFRKLFNNETKAYCEEFQQDLHKQFGWTTMWKTKFSVGFKKIPTSRTAEWDLSLLRMRGRKILIY